MDGVPVAEAASGWAGPEAVVFAVIGVLAVIAFVGLWRHISKCDTNQQLLHSRISAVKDEVATLKGEDVAKLKEDVAYIRATLSAHLDRFREEQRS